MPFILSFCIALVLHHLQFNFNFNFNLVWPTWATATRSHLQHVPDSDAAQNWSVRSLQRVVRKVSSRPLFGHVYVIDCHYNHADRAYWQCYRQGHFPGNPCCVITARRHFRQDMFGYYSHVGNTNGETLISTLMMLYYTHYHTRGMIYQY